VTLLDLNEDVLDGLIKNSEFVIKSPSTVNTTDCDKAVVFERVNTDCNKAVICDAATDFHTPIIFDTMDTVCDKSIILDTTTNTDCDKSSMSFQNLVHPKESISLNTCNRKAFRWRIRLAIFSNDKNDKPILCRMTMDKDSTIDQTKERILMHCKVHRPKSMFENFFVVKDGNRVRFALLDEKQLCNIELIHAISKS
jgi:hypothetical protein